MHLSVSKPRLRGKHFRGGFRVLDTAEIQLIINGLASGLLSTKQVRIWCAWIERTHDGQEPDLDDIKKILKPRDRISDITKSLHVINNYLATQTAKGHKRLIPRRVLREISQWSEGLEIAVLLHCCLVSMPGQGFTFRIRQDRLARFFKCHKNSINKAIKGLITRKVLVDVDPTKQGFNHPSSVKIHGKKYGYSYTIIRPQKRKDPERDEKGRALLASLGIRQPQ